MCDIELSSSFFRTVSSVIDVSSIGSPAHSAVERTGLL